MAVEESEGAGSQPLVSAVIAVYNGERFIGAAIDSVLAQTWSHVECVVVDDGSTDSTAAIVQAVDDDRVRYVARPNGGVSAARNTGIAASQGTFVAFLDADDLWLPGKVAAQVRAFERDPDLGLVYTAFRIVDEDVRERVTVKPNARHLRRRKMLFLEGSGIGLSFTAMLPRAVIDEVGPFDESLSTSADLEFACRVADRHRVVALDEPLSLYRTHAGQMHLNLDAFERDMLLVFDRWLGETSLRGRWLRRRAEANLYTRLALYELSRHRKRAAWGHVRRALAARPDRIVALPIAVMGVRLARHGEAWARGRRGHPAG